MIKLFIEQEYGYKEWFAELTEDEYELLIARWESMRGLNPRVPVTLIVPQAKEVMDRTDFDNMIRDAKRCHIFEHDDSWLEGSSYNIPKDKFFWMEGICHKEYGEWNTP